MTSDALASGSQTVFQSSQFTRPQDASKAPHLGSLLSGSARFCLDAKKQRMLRPGSEVADMENLLGPTCRHVHPVFKHSQRHYVGFVRDLVTVEHVRLFFVATKAGAQRFSIDVRASNRFLRPRAYCCQQARLRTLRKNGRPKTSRS